MDVYIEGGTESRMLSEFDRCTYLPMYLLALTYHCTFSIGAKLPGEVPTASLPEFRKPHPKDGMLEQGVQPCLNQSRPVGMVIAAESKGPGPGPGTQQQEGAAVLWLECDVGLHI